jgi:4-amino-4-deoxy-L-arabinose transferase-like glycosyltransferase
VIVDSRSERRFRIFLTAILAAGVALRLWTILAIPTRPVSDFFGYYVVAKNLVATGGYETEPGIAEARRSPAYPLVLTLAWLVEPANALLASKFLNLALFVLAGLAAAILARRLWGDTASLWTAAILALLPRSILMTNILAAENLIAPLLFVFLLLCASSWSSSFSVGRATWLGVVAGLLCLTRAVLYFVPIVWLAGAVAGRLGARRIVRELVILLVVLHAVLLPWALRNALSVERFTPFNLSGGVGIYVANNDNPSATGQWFAWSEDLEQRSPGVLARGDVAIDDAARAEASRWIREHPGAAARRYLRRLGIILKDDAFAAEFAIFAKDVPHRGSPLTVIPEGHALDRHRSLIQSVLRISGVLLALAAFGGFWLLLRRSREGSLTDRALAAGFVAAALYVPLISAAMVVNGRYRWAAEDVIAPLAGLFLARHASSRPTQT